MSSARDTAGYIHGTSPEEQLRLQRMNGLLNQREIQAIRPLGSERVLELGAGTGVFARAMAESLPEGFLLGIELDEQQLAAARVTTAGLANLELRQGDVLHPPLREEEWGSFDIVHARFLLEHLTRPQEALATMARAVRPGGRVVLVDDDHDTLRLWPESPAFMALWRAYCEQYSRRGMDPWVGRRLTGLLVGAGLRPLEADMLFFGACSGMERFETVVSNLIGVVAGAEDDIRRSGVLDDAGIREGLEEAHRWSQGADAALWYALPFAVGQRSD